ncbi:type II toxin-antitoxin system HicA family toxin [Bacillus sp. BP-3]|uniref:type II toxin-antitoxin system HicA family toxin n=1 Tax=Bacillus sp. BP-3 TaxID=3022773 RepID=UPI0023312E38|nr:type II toxin-antitoxin system HicA family toxin [Bacillus sp. BP-3]MDC2864564.1 type II toxin-antitoxin system HicA family toxin [Bacillus sp. BP-3]
MIIIESSKEVVTISSREVIKKLKKEGWFLTNIKGNHHQFKHPSKVDKVTVKHPCKNIPKGTLRSIYKQVGWL